MAERTVEVEEQQTKGQRALQQAEARAKKAESELRKLRASQGLQEARGTGLEAEEEEDGREGRRTRGASGTRTEEEARDGGRVRPEGDAAGDAETRERAEPRRLRRNEGAGREGYGPGDAESSKEPPTRSSAEGEPEMAGGEEELRKDSMMAHLLDSLEAGKDIGHYGRLVFAMVSRHFLPHAEVVAWLTKDRDFGEEEAELMLRQVEGRDYSPPKRAKILEYQREQEFPILPNPEDPDCGNLYRNLKFPDAVYKHISHYQEQKMEAEE